MDRESWRLVRRAVCQIARALPRPRRRPVYSDALIASMFLWAVAHDRCMRWACNRDHYDARLFAPRRLPSVSRFARRVAGPRVRRVLQLVHERLAGPVAGVPGLCYLDGLPLPIGPAGRDADARTGRVGGGFARGYKLHALAGPDRRIRVFAVAPLHAHEVPAALAMIAAVPRLSFGDESLVLADGNYDAARLHEAVAARGGALLAAPRGLSRDRDRLAAMGPARAAFVRAWREVPSLCRMVHRLRPRVEGVLSVLTATSGGLQGLPGYVRGLGRVTRWVGCKVILYNARLVRPPSARVS